jgi:hypothetical protein
MNKQVFRRNFNTYLMYPCLFHSTIKVNNDITNSYSTINCISPFFNKFVIARRIEVTQNI